MGKLDGLVLVTNPGSFGIDLYATDNINHHILFYAGDFCPAAPPAPACTKTGSILTQANNIIYPNGPSADTAGNLFVVDTAPGSSPLPQVWVVPFQNGAYQTAVAIDTTSPAGSLGKKQPVVETMIVNAPLGVQNCGTTGHPACLANVGDLLVVSNTPDEILRYPGNGATGPLSTNHSPSIFIRQCATRTDTNCIPSGSLPQGIAVWPADNTVLITVPGGMVLRFNLSSGAVTQATTLGGLPSGLVKIKTANTKNGALGFVLMNGQGNHGSILELGSCANNPNLSGCSGNPANIVVLASVSSGVAAPLGLAVTSAVQAAANTCQPTQQNPNGGCDLLGDPAHNVTVLKHVVNNAAAALSGSIVEDVCIVQTDPRPHTALGACNDAQLPVNQVCPGFDNTVNSLFIPGYLCGGSGSGPGNSPGTGFALIRSLTTHAQSSVSEWNGTYVESSADSTQLLPGNNLGANNPFCGPRYQAPAAAGIGTLVWAPLKNEGAIDEGFQMLDITDGCGTGHGGSGYTSLWAIGLALDPTAQELNGGGSAPVALENFAQGKYTHLINTLTTFNTGGNITSPPNVLQQLYNSNNNNSPGCIDLSLADFTNAVTVDTINTPAWIADLQNAANLLTNDDQFYSTSCDYIVSSHLANFVESTPPTVPVVLNPSGQIRSRLANLYYTINTDILGNPAPSAWPPAVSVSASVSPQAVANNNTSTKLTWGLNGNSGPCTVTTTDPTTPPPPSPVSTTGFANLGPWTNAGVTYTYTVACPVPIGTVNPAQLNTMTVTAHLTIWPFVTISLNPAAVAAGQSTQITWTPPKGSTTCTLTTDGQGSFANPGQGTTTDAGPTDGLTADVATYNSVTGDNPVVKFTASCAAGASPASTQLTIWPPIPVVLNPTSVTGGQGTQVTWTPPAGATTCMLVDDGQGTFATSGQGATTDTGPTDGVTADVVTYNSAPGDNAAVNFTASCAAGASPGMAQLTVNPPP